MQYARIIDRQAVDVTGQDPAGLFHPDIAAAFVEVPDDVVPGSTLDPETGAWTPPDALPEAAPAPETGNLRPTPPEFKAVSFTFAERLALKAARLTDDVVADFFDLIDDPRLTVVDLTLPSTRDAIGYLTTTTPALLTPERAAQVLAGLPAPSSGGA
jgi:hypothetical protein